MSLGNLGRRKGRTSLTLVGVVIGVAALVLMVSLGVGLERSIVKVFQSDDAMRTIFVQRPRGGADKAERKMSPFSFGGMGLPITDRDLKELRAMDGVATVSPNLGLFLDIEIEGVKEPEEFVPVGGLLEAEVPDMKRFLIAGDVWKDPTERALLLPSRMLAIRFQKKPADIVGKKIVFSRAFSEDQPDEKDVTFVVVGVLDTERLGLKARQLYAPMDRAMELRAVTKGGNLPLFGDRKDVYPQAEVKAKDVTSVDDLKNRLKNSGYEVMTPTDIMGFIKTFFLVIEAFMACIGAIGLIVSIFGIANTMAMAVLERTREIGIMKAVGARPGAILRVYLVEAAAIGLIGGLVGLTFGFVAGTALNFAAHKFVEIPDDMRLFHVSIWLAGGAVLFSMVISIIAGIIPAMRASQLDPVRALRYE
jgi:putative ABC transport system permease protein